MPESTSLSAPRVRAVAALVSIEEHNMYTGDAIRASGLEPRERRQLTEYVSGVTRQRRWLDFILADFYHGEIADLQPKLRQILRLGLYEMLFLQTPIHAAVNEYVEIAKSEIRQGAGGLVNGVLRAIDRKRDQLPSPDTGSTANDLAIRHSHPTWMVNRWLDHWGADQTEALLKWNNDRPIHGVRANLLKLSAAELHSKLEQLDVDYEPSPYLSDFVRMPSLQPLLKAGLLDQGDLAVQDESAGLAVRMLAPEAGESVLDMCAAPGGKSLYMAGLMEDKGTIYACDIHEERLQMVAEAATRQSATSIKTVAADARNLPREGDFQPVDRVLLDAPCSGHGVLTKRADLRWQRKPSDLDELSVLQDELLDAAANSLKPGGVLVYSTCTIEPEENEQRIEAFLERHPDFQPAEAPADIPRQLLNQNGFIATFPPRDSIDGAFAARLVKAS